MYIESPSDQNRLGAENLLWLDLFAGGDDKVLFRLIASFAPILKCLIDLLHTMISV